jgi:hypothetical protein
MFFDASQTLEALHATERPRPPVQSGQGKSNLLKGVIVGILIGKRLGR